MIPRRTERLVALVVTLAVTAAALALPALARPKAPEVERLALACAPHAPSFCGQAVLLSHPASVSGRK